MSQEQQQPQETVEGFDLRVEIKDPKTGKTLKYQPYVMRCSASEGQLFERPPGSGYWYYANGKVAKSPEMVLAKSEPTQAAIQEKPASKVVVKG